MVERGEAVDEKSVLRTTKREMKLISLIRQMGWGEVKIRIENGQPVVIYEAIRTIRLEEKSTGGKSSKKKRAVKPLEEVAEICLGEN